MKLFARSLFALSLVLILALPALSASKADVVMLDTQMVGDTQLWLNGIALREKFVFDVYVAALYLPDNSSDAASILAKDEPRMMVMHFLRDVGADKINDAWYEGLEANVETVSPELKAKFDQLAGMMEDIKDNQAMAFTYIPNEGTKVAVNGKDKGIIPGKDFADAILATWIGPKPGPGKTFKAEILGQ